MCSILTYYNSRGTSEELIEENFINALNMLAPKGLDSNNYFIDKNSNVYMGHTRLSILGVDNEAQPISNGEGKIQIVVNGAFYNYKEIRHSLINKGHVFKTENDSEITLHLYEGFGVEDRLLFLDRDLSMILRKIISNSHFSNGVEKYVLRESCKGIILETIRNRRKLVFDAPPLISFNIKYAYEFI